MQGADESRFLDGLYEAALDPARWPAVMEDLADLLGGAAGWLTRMSVADGSGEGVLARLDPAMATLYETYYARLNPFSNEPDPAAYMAAWRPEVLTDEAWLGRSELERTEYFNDFMRPQDIHSGMIIRLAAYGFDVCALTMTRTMRQGAFGQEALSTARRLHPHLRRAFRLTENLAMGGGALPAGVAQALDASPHALLVLSTSGLIRRLNGPAERMLQEGGGLRAVNSRLVAERPEDAAALEALLGAAGTADPEQRRAGEMKLAWSEDRPAVSITASPVRSSATAVFEDGPAVLVCVTDPLAAGPWSPASPNLTLRERDALQWVAAGKSDWEIGMILGVSPTTVRFHVDNARRKLGAVNRAHAVALLLAAQRAAN
ncbi:MAG: helix-turn-helix domain-containing protein [Phenylobacterium sp.]|uniref:helix-turn-helix transcriptional regulator n=1 Tax=Phenylobacterium sp. TaxID=1871053 RepID=UPI001A5DBA2F|nr:helix-turn-helix domain-containing protein [Phenylobacterium sp.]MBL8772352.1 helix-turn-helix domain-containing protein [Phenylobacterium sp.]